MSKQAEAKQDRKIYPHIYNFKKTLNTEFFYAAKCFESTEVDGKHVYMCPWGLFGPPTVRLTSCWNTKETSAGIIVFVTSTFHLYYIKCIKSADLMATQKSLSHYIHKYKR